uniref:EEF1A lysine methyltransferase 3 n=1 Tax=Neogobius melanostomus TaxID=47308 RepID=A0A8C6V396_9GOBI
RAYPGISDMNGEVDDPFPMEDCLFEETFSNESVYNLSGHELRIKQLFGANLGVAAPVWEAAIHLSNYLAERSAELKGKRVIELGSGTGLLGIFAARLGAVVTLTDLPVALPPISANVGANTPSGGWPSLPPHFPSDWDLVLGADIIYIPETFPLLIETLVHLCRSGTVVFFCSKMRKEHRTHIFMRIICPPGSTWSLCNEMNSRILTFIRRL